TSLLCPFSNSTFARFGCFNDFCISLRRHVKLHAEDTELGTVRVSQQLCELPHAPPVQAFTVRLEETFR
ncbi:hypothetical protein TNCV_2520551, partial [Trichonephila clavipes]